MRYTICLVLLALSAPVLCASGDAVAADSVQDCGSRDSIQVGQPNFFRRVYDVIYNYIDGTNDVRPEKKFDISVLAGPKYSSSRSFGLAAVAQGLYSLAPGDTLTPMSSVSVKADGSLTGYYEVGIEGINIFRGDKYRLDYTLKFMSERAKFWGIGYGMASDDANESKYSLRQGTVKIDFSIEFLPNWYVAPSLQYTYVGGRRFEYPERWDGLPSHTNSFAPGASLIYDTRDHVTNSYKGVYIAFTQQFYGRLFNGDNNFSSSELTFKYFTGLWRGCILATQVHGNFTYGHTPWGMLSQFGGSKVMRGYYEGRYRDKDLMDVTVELRQHVWKRSGIAVWLGAATVFPEFSALRWRKVLPNGGVGYRFEFKHRINARLDVGFGKHGKSIELSLNEAF